MSAAAHSLADVVVVGAGVIGVTVAPPSAARAYSTVLIECADGFGQRASARSCEVIKTAARLCGNTFKNKGKRPLA